MTLIYCKVEYEFAQINSIPYCDAEGAYTKVVFNDKQSLLILRTLGETEEMLPPEIFFMHSSFYRYKHECGYALHKNRRWLCCNEYQRKTGGFKSKKNRNCLRD